MQPAPQDLTIYQGDDYSFFFRLRERIWDVAAEQYVAGDYVDLTGWSGKSQIRVSPQSADPVAEFEVVITNQVTIKGGVILKLTNAQTAALLPALQSGGVWDVQLTNEVAEVQTFIAGKVTVTAEVTRP